MNGKNQQTLGNGSGSYDQEWVELIKEAKQSGLTITSIRQFLQKGEEYSAMKSLSSNRMYNI